MERSLERRTKELEKEKKRIKKNEGGFVKIKAKLMRSKTKGGNTLSIHIVL